MALCGIRSAQRGQGLTLENCPADDRCCARLPDAAHSAGRGPSIPARKPAARPEMSVFCTGRFPKLTFGRKVTVSKIPEELLPCWD